MTPGTPRIRQSSSAEDCGIARTLFLEYAKWLDIDLCFQGFSEELATLPGAYAPPSGRLFLAGDAGGGEARGCVALRKLSLDPSRQSCQLQRPGVRSAF